MLYIKMLDVYTVDEKVFLEAIEAYELDTISESLEELASRIDLKEFDRKDTMMVYMAPPLQYALDKRNWALCDWLISKGADPNSCLISTSSANDRIALDYLMKSPGSDVEKHKHDMFVWTAINGHLDLAQELLDMGADIHHAPQNHMYKDYALFHAASLGYLEVVKWLLLKGADPNTNREKILEVTRGKGLEDVHTLFSQITS